jgi:hypothetical protein
MGEVMAGLQAGLTGGAHTVDGAPEAFFGAVNFEERRGFIVPEAAFHLCSATVTTS